jgi:hypothetical protein
MDEMDKDGSGEIEFDEFDAVVRTRQTRSFCSLQFLLLSP